MNPFEMVVMIVAIPAVASVLRAKYGYPSKRDRKRAESQAPYLDLETNQLREEVRALKDRVATLERIATDGSGSLDREIEALRVCKSERLDR